MAGSTTGKLFTVTTWGESHGPALGVTIDGCPAGLRLCAEDIQAELDKRKPSASPSSTQRREPDEAVILSGVFGGMTTGTPISIAVFNRDQHSADYSQLESVYRPGHADRSFDVKYGIRDHRGGGRSSGRETLSRVAAGAVAKKLLGELGISFSAYALSIGPYTCRDIDESAVYKNLYRLADPGLVESVDAFVCGMKSEKNSAGGVIECVIRGVPAGLGDPVFDKLDARLASALMSIGAVKGVEIGDGFAAAVSTGAENNDAFVNEDGHITLRTNHSGGILGGISTGAPIILRAAVKPTPSIARAQQTVDKNGNAAEIEIKGRHDVLIVPRAVPVVEAMCAVTLADAILCGMGCKLENVKKIYE